MIEFNKIANKDHYSRELPVDPSNENRSREVRSSCFSRVATKEPTKPVMVHTSSALLNELGITIGSNNDFTNIVSGAAPFPDAKPYAMCYGGHQFGHWAGQLGDGRAINIAELDIKGNNYKFQLKGAGPTPYSRGSDGLAVLRSSVREYLCSEAMHHLGVPTSRAMSLVKTGDLVTRDILYNGNPKDEQGAIVCRVAQSFIRFGNFEIFAARKELDVLKQLLDYTIKHHFSHLGEPSKETYLDFFKEVANRTRKMIIHWQRVGFVHGVMNTDNMSILGLTIDYGPYGWLEDYNPFWTPNTTDHQHKRYRFENQGNISLWNLVQLANALYPLVGEVDSFQEILEKYKVDYRQDHQKMMLSKLGLYEEEVPEKIITDLTEMMTRTEVDMTLFYRELSENQENLSFNKFWEILSKSSYQDEKILRISRGEWEKWYNLYYSFVEKESTSFLEREEKMKRVNPKYVLRNYMAQLAIDDAEKGDYSLLDELYNLLLTPYDDQPGMEKWYKKRPEWAKHKVGCSMLSCSS